MTILDLFLLINDCLTLNLLLQTLLLMEDYQNIYKTNHIITVLLKVV